MWCNDLEYLLGHTACGVMTLSIIRSHCMWCNDLEYLLGHTACGVMTLSTY